MGYLRAPEAKWRPTTLDLPSRAQDVRNKNPPTDRSERTSALQNARRMHRSVTRTLHSRRNVRLPLDSRALHSGGRAKATRWLGYGQGQAGPQRERNLSHRDRDAVAPAK